MPKRCFKGPYLKMVKHCFHQKSTHTGSKKGVKKTLLTKKLPDAFKKELQIPRNTEEAKFFNFACPNMAHECYQVSDAQEQDYTN